jgi:hypothetical protein
MGVELAISGVAINRRGMDFDNSDAHALGLDFATFRLLCGIREGAG